MYQLQVTRVTIFFSGDPGSFGHFFSVCIYVGHLQTLKIHKKGEQSRIFTVFSTRIKKFKVLERLYLSYISYAI